ncbi:MAG: RodZ domain-containing protein [Arenicellales bacterium]|jgi:cytoskeleton protein RodZ
MFPNQDDQVLGPGKLLQIAREEKNLRPEDVAYEIRLTPSQVLALEENDYSKMPEETYVRGYLRNYARLVGIPENTILMAFARETRSSEKKPQQVIPSGESDINKSSKGIRMFAVIFLIAVIALSAVWVLVPHDKLPLTGEKADSPAVEEKTVAKVEEVPVGASTLSLDSPVESSVVEKTTITSAMPTTSTAETTSAAIVMPQSASSQEQQAISETTPVQVQAEVSIPVQPVDTTVSVDFAETNTTPATTGVAAAGSRETESSVEAASDGTLSISYSNDSWTDVRDANGKKLLYRTVKKGENIALAGKLPLSVFFGFAQGVKVTFNGEEIDVPGYTRGVFARFTVGESVNP